MSSIGAQRIGTALQAMNPWWLRTQVPQAKSFLLMLRLLHMQRSRYSWHTNHAPEMWIHGMCVKKNLCASCVPNGPRPPTATTPTCTDVCVDDIERMTHVFVAEAKNAMSEG